MVYFNDVFWSLTTSVRKICGHYIRVLNHVQVVEDLFRLSKTRGIPIVYHQKTGARTIKLGRGYHLVWYERHIALCNCLKSYRKSYGIKVKSWHILIVMLFNSSPAQNVQKHVRVRIKGNCAPLVVG